MVTSCAEDASQHYVVKMCIISIRIVLFMHNMKENIEHIRYCLQVYRFHIEDVTHQQAMFNAAQRLNVILNANAIKENSALVYAAAV